VVVVELVVEVVDAVLVEPVVQDARPVVEIELVAPAAIASSTAYWINGLSTMGSISFGLALVAGKKRVPRPATGKTADKTGGCKIDLRLFVKMPNHSQYCARMGASPVTPCNVT